MEQRTLKSTELAPFNVPDGELLTATRYGGEVYAGVRVGGAEADRHSWIYGRYREHKNATYEGFWAMNDGPLIASPRGLRIENADKDGDVFLMAQGAPLRLMWQVGALGQIAGADGAFEIRIWSAADGSETPVGALNFTVPTDTQRANVAAMLPSLPTGAYCVWLRLSAPGVYRGLPPDFEQVTGTSPTDSRYSWRDARTGRVYAFVPLYAVGAMPPVGHPLRTQYETLLAQGKVQKQPQWTGWLLELDAQGAPALKATEWAMIRLLVQDEARDGQWPEESAVDVGAAPSASLLKLQNGALVPIPLRASLRSVGSFKEIDGRLFVGAMEAGEDGRYAAIIETQTVADSPNAALGQVQTDRRWCECALLLETIHAIERFPDRPGGSIFGVSSCEIFERVSYLPPGERLIGRDPGGRSLVVCHQINGRHWMARAVESDFSTSARSWPAFGYVVTESPTGVTVGPGVAALYNSVLWEWNNRVWGITDADPEMWEAALASGDEQLKAKSLTFQTLCWFDGQFWHKVARWPNYLYSMTRGGACGACMLLFGRRENDRKPIAFRYNGEHLESNLAFPYYVERADTTLSEDGAKETLLLCCVKADPSAPDNEVLDGFYLVETDGKLVGEEDDSGGGGSGGSDPPIIHARDAWESMPEGTRVYVARYQGEGENLLSPLLKFSVTDATSGDGLEMTELHPCLWALADAQTPFPLFEAVIPDAAMLTAMEAFNVSIAYAVPRALPKPARKWVDIMVLIPPGFQWDTVIQPM